MFWNKKRNIMTKEFMKYFKVEAEDCTASAYGDITDEDLKSWLYAVTQAIGKSFNRHQINNYLMGQMSICGQLIEFAFIKSGKEGPHTVRMKLEEENKRLRDEILLLKKHNVHG